MKLAGHFRFRMRSRQKMLAIGYRAIRFHAIAILQLISSIVVFGIMSYFVTKLRGSHMFVPYPFVINLTVATISTMGVALITTVYAPNSPRPSHSIILNSVLLGLWVISFAVLTNSMKTTITSACTTDSWGNGTGVMVCNLYKTAFSFEISAILTTVLAIAVNYHVRRSTTASGPYIPSGTQKFTNLPENDDDDDDSRRLIGPLSSVSFRSPDMPDDRSLGFAATPRSAAFERDQGYNSDAKSENTELTRMSPLYQNGSDLGDGIVTPFKPRDGL